MWQRIKSLPWQNPFSFLLAILVWQVASLLVAERIFLPSPLDVLAKFFSLFTQLSFFNTFLFSLSRVMLGFFLGLILGLILAILAGRFAFLRTLLYPYMVTVRSVPVASFIVLVLLWFSSAALSGVISFLIVLPVVYQGVLGAFLARDKQLSEMAEVFAIPFSRQLFCIYIPALRPALLSSAITGIGLAWKSGIAAELIGLPDHSIGLALYRSKLYLDTPALFALTLVIVLGSLATEKLVAALLRLLLGGYRT